MSPSSSAMYRRKRIGPRTDPWGTPHSSDAVVEQDPLYLGPMAAWRSGSAVGLNQRS